MTSSLQASREAASRTSAGVPSMVGISSGSGIEETRPA